MTTPPPQGQNPFAQGQQPYGQPPQGQAPYGAPPQGYPPQPAQPGFPQQGPIPYAPVAPQRPKRGVKWYLRIVLAIAGLSVVVGGLVLNNDSEDAKKLAVGDCLYNKGTANDPDVIQVDCTDSKATHKVLKKADGASLPSLTCQNVTGTTATLTWKETGESFTLCLGANK
ncbi:LppU/SCO3897 family protein [Streptomyces mirabilis]|uniref:LppU/SCO3897 family protein n=1 Tax=Streptomyces mirabilis TaxID=68239 RepID=UPI0033A429FF